MRLEEGGSGSSSSECVPQPMCCPAAELCTIWTKEARRPRGVLGQSLRLV